MSFIWIGLIITLTLIELLTSKLITIWYVLSSILALIVSFFIDSYIIQFIIFSFIGTVLMFYFRDNVLKKLKLKKEKLLLNKIVIVTEDITKKKMGKVKINNRSYNAVSNKKIKKGKNVKIVHISGKVLKVEEVKNNHEIYKKNN